MGSSPPPDQPERPLNCGHCGSGLTATHCEGRPCGWSLCDACGWISAFILGRLSTMPPKLPKSAPGAHEAT